MQGNARDSLRVTQEAVGAYTSQAGFQGMGTITIEHCVRVIVPSKDVVQPKWRPAGNAGQHLHHTVAFLCNCANPVATRRGGAS